MHPNNIKRIYASPFAALYQHSVYMAEGTGRTIAELHVVI